MGYFAWAPEYLITVSVAKAVWEWCAPMSVWPEFRLMDAMRDAGMAGAAGVPGRLDGNRRADLLLYRNGGRPHAIVEVKRNVEGWSRIAPDVERMQAVVAGGASSFQLGVVAFNCTQMASSSANGGVVLKDRLLRMAEAADSLSRPGWRCGLSSRGVSYDGHEYWSAAAVVMERVGPRA
ncbi:hypothetical protein [Magnetospirillum sp. UT-4]|uniref:hypothetical protein n=1 Tax=Magnetospirillum sp. UT-4 TaxID=2681467 RepID=UPI001574BF44|nr:hypothetical protein [Magnetospirillum sp. UT-4]